MKLKKLLTLLMTLCLISTFCFGCININVPDNDDEKKTEQKDDKDDEKESEEETTTEKQDEEGIVGEWKMEFDYSELLYTLLELEVDAELVISSVWKFEDDGTYKLSADKIPSQNEIEAYASAYFDAAMEWAMAAVEMDEDEYKAMIVQSGYDSYEAYEEETKQACITEVETICDAFAESLGGTYEFEDTTIELDVDDYLEIETDGNTMMILDASDDLASFVGLELVRQ